MAYLIVIAGLLLYTVAFTSLFYNSIAFDKLDENKHAHFYKFWLIFSLPLLVSVYTNLQFGLFIYFRAHLSLLLPFTTLKGALLILFFLLYAIIQAITLKALYAECESKRAFIVVTVLSTFTTPIVVIVSTYSNYLLMRSLIDELSKIIQHLATRLL